MYLINRDKNRIEKLEQRVFQELGFRERDNLQEWIANEPQIFGEDLLVIQKEFSGFDDTKERLDLLALDKQGDLVIIENKLDDTGRDVTWQALKYASFCSGLSKENIRKIYQQYLDKADPGVHAEEKLSEFYENSDYEDLILNKGLTQRIILVAAQFRKEVTSTVLWLMNYKLRIQCFRVTPYEMGDQLFLNVEQIIPTKDAEDYMIGIAEKVQDDLETQTELKHRHIIRKEFWTRLIQHMNTKSTLYQNISPSIYNWLGAGSGVRGISLNFGISKTYGRVEVYIDRGDKAENEDIFDQLFAEKEKLEQNFGGALIWERLETKRACRIKSEIDKNVFIKENWEEVIEFMTDSMVQLEKTFKPILAEINSTLKSHA
ncbi:DUF4268 domain-containing protein [candidate division KSB3 bacterium]|uniref:DUF4268 domain-containing protein n=1 Tax=candidate division KSB3 bacterium TaxID=2044937 RepID=A0A9D5Q4G0_9BACT|nr:DUF4268 domain-containing protein [candidate division KSB3 bacterium]MBD3323520.1 DUF4268 domain-containing protein [candidate division KSB3 bacterium]